jgi:hypothetical protein
MVQRRLVVVAADLNFRLEQYGMVLRERVWVMPRRVPAGTYAVWVCEGGMFRGEDAMEMGEVRDLEQATEMVERLGYEQLDEFWPQDAAFVCDVRARPRPWSELCEMVCNRPEGLSAEERMWLAWLLQVVFTSVEMTQDVRHLFADVQGSHMAGILAALQSTLTARYTTPARQYVTARFEQQDVAGRLTLREGGVLDVEGAVLRSELIGRKVGDARAALFLWGWKELGGWRPLDARTWSVSAVRAGMAGMAPSSAAERRIRMHQLHEEFEAALVSSGQTPEGVPVEAIPAVDDNGDQVG